MVEPKKTLKQKVYQGIKDYLILTAYLWLVFALFVLYRSVILAEQDIPFVAHGLALLNALALAKVMLVAQDLHFAEGKFNNAPLIYPTLFKSIAFALVLGLFKIVEEALIGLVHHHSFSQSIAEIGGGTLKGILSLMAILTVLLIPFFAFSELRNNLTQLDFHKLFFESRHPTQPTS
jgi:type III secretory pathway component EscS